MNAGGVSIYQHLLHQGGEPLPDEDRYRARSGSQVRWAPGAEDGARGHHFGVQADTALATRLADVIQRATGPVGGRRGRQEVAGLLSAVDDALGVVEPLLDELVGRGRIRADRLRDLAREIATTSPERNAVKIAMALLGLAGLDEADRDLVMVLGRHDEFTLYAAIALGGGLPDPEPSLWELGRAVTGWGRIHVVERLAGTRDPALRSWLLREGYDNSVTVQYTARIAATTGGLADALRSDEVDDALLQGARSILAALLAEGPAEGMDDYGDGSIACTYYVRQVRRRPADLRDVATLTALRRFLAEDADWLARAGSGWTATRRSALDRDCAELLARPELPELVAAGLAAEDRSVFATADGAARVLGIPTFDAHLERLQADPRDPYVWSRAAEQADADGMGRLVGLAQRALPLEAMATGPALELGVGQEYVAFHVLDALLQQLGRFPGLGWPLVEAALASPIVRCRHGAAGVLEQWTVQAWPDSAFDALGAALSAEPDPDLRERLARLAP